MLYGAMNFPVRPVLKEIDSIAELKFDYLELTMDPPQAHYKMIQEEKENIIRALARHKMKILCHLPSFLSTADLTPSIREASLDEVLNSLDVAAELGCLKVVLHPSYMLGLSIFVMEKAREYAIESLDAIMKKANELGLIICLENLFPRAHSLVEPDDFAEIFGNFPKLKLTLDTGHAHIGDKDGRRALNFIKRFPDRISHIHASDNLGEEDNHLPVGAGTVNFPEIVKAIKEIGYDDTITLEVFSKDRDYLRISREKLEAMFDVL
jgi:sugar phosphate isomerase/epimerase